MEEPVATVGVAKRKDLMDNIKGRLNANVYNAATHYTKNEKDLTEKVKFFEKKIATGQMKDYMTPRYEAAKELLARLQAKRPANMPVAKTRAPRVTVPAPMAAPMAAPVPKAPTPKALTAAPVNGEVPLTIRAPKQRGVIGMVNMGAPRATSNVKMAKTRNRTAKAATAVTANTTAAKVAKTRNRTAKKNKASPNRLPVPPGSPAANMGSKPLGLNMNALTTKLNALPKSRKVTARAASKPKAATARKPRTVPASNQYLEQAIQEALPLPDFYNPYTGVKYTPQDDPIQDIEKAYIELKKIRSGIWRKAATMRKRGLKKTTAAE
jgi:hypothetical protein